MDDEDKKQIVGGVSMEHLGVGTRPDSPPAKSLRKGPRRKGQLNDG